MLDGDLATTETSQKGALPARNLYDIHCPMMGGPDYRLNYLASACRARQLDKSCTEKKCDRRVNLVRPGLVQMSSDGVKQEQRTEDIPVGKKPVRECKECGRTMAIVGRGLCGACLQRLRKAGTIDKKYPSQRPRKVRQACEEKPQPSKVETADEPHVDPVLGPLGDDEVIEITIEFIPRDRELFERLTKWANEQRREVEDQVLFALDNLVEGMVQRGEL